MENEPRLMKVDVLNELVVHELLPKMHWVVVLVNMVIRINTYLSALRLLCIYRDLDSTLSTMYFHRSCVCSRRS